MPLPFRGTFLEAGLKAIVVITRCWPPGLRTSPMSPRLLLPLALLAFAACPSPKLKKVLPPNERVDTYNQLGASSIDVLWVIDNSGSMAPRQENLAKNFQSFIDVFTKTSIDYRLAITTTDIFKEKGAFVGVPSVISPSTPQPAQTFATSAHVGTNGSPYEAGLEAAQMALDLQTAANQPKLAQIDACTATCRNEPTCISNCKKSIPIDFLRPDAYLYFVFVSDEDDESSQDVRYYWRSYEDTKGVGNDGTVTTAAIIGDVPTNTCGAGPGTRYKALSDLTGGEVGSVCDASFADTLKKLATDAVGLHRKFGLVVKPNQMTIQVDIKYPCNINPELTKACAMVDSSGCMDMAADAQELVCTPVQGGADGWSYQADSNTIYFAGESVPYLGGTVEIYYYPDGLGP